MLSNPTAQGLVLPSRPMASSLLHCPKLLKGLFCSVFSTGCTVSHYHPGSPHFIGEKIEGTEESGPLTPFSIHLVDLDLCSGDGLAVWGPVLSGPGPDHGTGAAALTLVWLGRTPVRESCLDSTARLQSLVFPPPELYT